MHVMDCNIVCTTGSVQVLRESDTKQRVVERYIQ